MNRYHLDTAAPDRDPGRPDTLPRRVIRLLLRGPAMLESPAARWAASLLALAGAALLVWSGVIHLQLWGDGYRDISVIGPLFLAQGMGSIGLALVLVLFRWLVLMAAGAVTLAATAVGLLLSVYAELFGYRESLAVPYAETSLVVEFTGAAVLLAAALLLLATPVRAAEAGGQPLPKPVDSPLLKAPSGGAERLRRPDRRGRAGTQPVDEPGRGPRRRCAVVGGECPARFIDPGGPALGGPPPGQVGDGWLVGDLVRLALHDEVEFLGSDAQRAAGVTGEVSSLASCLPGLEPERPAEPQPADARDVRAAVRVDGRQPAGMTARAARPWRLGHAARQAAFDARPLNRGSSITGVEVDYVHSS